jgi:hypothetical protein
MARRLDLDVIPWNDTNSNLPAGADTFYLCTNCRGIVRSLPDHPSRCACGNVSVDPDGGRAGARNPEWLVVLRIGVRKPD